MKDFKCSKIVLLFFTLNYFISFLNVFAEETGYGWIARSRHNQYRKKHYANALYYSKDLHQKALKCARYYVNRGVIDHSCPHASRAGENLWAQWGGQGQPIASKIARRAVQSWYDEERQHKYRGLQDGTGHFTQMVWKGSQKLGFGIAKRGNMVVAVALYYPPGNYIGRFHTNVRRP